MSTATRWYRPQANSSFTVKVESGSRWLKGGAGSGNFGHSGRPGAIGGSGSGKDDDAEAARDWKEHGTEAKAFKEWFGDSKVVDADGKPLVVYHGTDQDFSTFDAGKAGTNTGNYGWYGRGFSFSTNPDIASGYTGNVDENTPKPGANVKQVYLSIKNPFIIDNEPQKISGKPRTLLNDLAGLKELSEDERESIESERESGDRKFADALLETVFGYSKEGLTRSASASERFRELLDANGHDGVRTNRGKGLDTEWTAFQTTQIKSATGNRGTFDPKSPDIRKSTRWYKGGHDVSGEARDHGRFAVTEGSGEAATHDSAEHGPTKLQQALLADAKKIQVTDEVVFRANDEAVDRSDNDSIERAMTPDERREMENHLSDSRSEAADSALDDFEPYIDEKELASEAGWSDSDIRDKATDLISEDTEAETRDKLAGTIDKWYNDTRKYGEEGIRELVGKLEDADAPDEFVTDVDNLRTQAEEDIQEARDREEESQRQNAAEDYEYDDSDDRREYLWQFYDDNEERFQPPEEEPKKDTWGVDDTGDPAYVFDTSAGNQYKILTQDRKFASLHATEIMFSDKNNRFDVTGAGNAVEVFKKVSTAVTALAQKKDLDAIYCSAHDEPGKQSRRTLYNRLVKTLAQLNPAYQAIAVEHHARAPNTRGYLVVKRDKMPEYRAKVQEMTHSATMGDGTITDLVKAADTGNVRIIDMPAECRDEWFTEAGWQGIVAEKSAYRGRWYVKTFDESKVNRDHGKFAPKDGGETSKLEKAPIEWVLEVAKRNADMRIPRTNESKEDANSYAWNDRKERSFRRTAEKHGFYEVDMPLSLVRHNEREVAPERQARLDEIGGTTDPIFIGIDRHMGTGEPQYNVDDGNNRVAWAIAHGKDTIRAFVTPHEAGDIERFEKDLAAAKVKPDASKQTETPEFKAWFSGSKVVDEDGKPLVVYHGSGRDFHDFDTDKMLQLGSHFGTVDVANQAAENRGADANVKSCYLSIQNPIRLHDWVEWSPETIARSLKAEHKIDIGKPKTPNDVKAALMKLGYDGVVYLNRCEVPKLTAQSISQRLAMADKELYTATDAEYKKAIPEATDSWIAFHPTQIKSATGNSGKFDPSDPDIRKAFDPDKHPRDERGRFGESGMNREPAEEGAKPEPSKPARPMAEYQGYGGTIAKMPKELTSDSQANYAGIRSALDQLVTIGGDGHKSGIRVEQDDRLSKGARAESRDNVVATIGQKLAGEYKEAIAKHPADWTYQDAMAVEGVMHETIHGMGAPGYHTGGNYADFAEEGSTETLARGAVVKIMRDAGGKQEVIDEIRNHGAYQPQVEVYRMMAKAFGGDETWVSEQFKQTPDKDRALKAGELLGANPAEKPGNEYSSNNFASEIGHGFLEHMGGSTALDCAISGYGSLNDGTREHYIKGISAYQKIASLPKEKRDSMKAAMDSFHIGLDWSSPYESVKNMREALKTARSRIKSMPNPSTDWEKKETATCRAMIDACGPLLRDKDVKDAFYIKR